MSSSLAALSLVCPEFVSIRNAKMAYAGVVGLGAVYGFGRGTVNWINWLSKRKQMKLKDNRFINADMINPILNVGKDAGYLGWYAVSSALVSGFIVGTYPVSVPALLFFSEKEDSTGDDVE